MTDMKQERPDNGTDPELERSPAHSIPEPGVAPEPRFDEPSPPAPAVVDAPGRNTEF